MKKNILCQYVSALLFAYASMAAFSAHAGPNLVINGSTVYDKKTDLTWQRCSVGLRWNESTKYCVGVKKTMTFGEANSSNWSGNWRMPTIEELKTLIEKKGADGLFIDSNAFPDTADGQVPWYWSSTPDSEASFHWFVNFEFGQAYGNGYGRGRSFAVRLVRGGQ